MRIGYITIWVIFIYTPNETSATVTKRWSDDNNKDKIRPESVKVQLYANGTKKGAIITLKQNNNWTHMWTNLPEKENGVDIKYTVKEVDKVKGYKASVDDNNHGNMIITKSHTPKEVKLPKTGDSNGLLPYSIALVGSALAAFGLFAARKRIAR